MTLDMSFDQLSSNATYMAAFKTEYAKTIAASLALPATSIEVVDVIAGSVIVTSNIHLPAGSTSTAIDNVVTALTSGTTLSQEFKQKYGVVAVVGALLSGPAIPSAPTAADNHGKSSTVTIAAAVGAAGGTALIAAIVAFVVIHR